jgi:mutator protein MutT
MKKEPGKFCAAVCTLILNDRNEVLITQRNPNREHHGGEWETPTGRLDQGEGFPQALVREVKEELDIAVEPLDPITTFHFFRGPEKVEHVGVTYICRFKGRDDEVHVDGVEEVAYRWVSLDDALAVIKDESIKRDILKAQEYLKR